MKKMKIIDAVGGTVHISKRKGKYFKTQDSASPSGHSLLAQIDMTHSGIVTKNYGFYLPARMKAGATTFTRDYNKPVLIGHDEAGDTKPVGRVVGAEYVDTSETYRHQDSRLKGLFEFQDGKSDTETMLDFVQHVIREYDSRDSYRGLGHLRGTVKVTDPEAIEGILNDTYLTVSTSMVSDSATCSICGTDWVNAGLCDHSRGQMYDDNVCVVVPGKMEYDHLGIVNTPADPHAHDFTIVSDTPGETTVFQIDQKQKDLYKTHNDYDIAAQLFACKDNELISLSSESDVNLIEIKDNIQKMENAMKTIEEKIKDALDVKVEVYRFGNEDGGSKEVTVREYMEDLDVSGVQNMVAQIAKMLKSDDSATPNKEEITKIVDSYCAENFDLVNPEKEEGKEEGQENDSAQEGFFGEVLYGDEVLVSTDSSYKGKTAKKKRKKKVSKKMNDKFKLEDGEEITLEIVKIELEELTKVEDSGLDHEASCELAELVALYKNEDAVTVATFNWKDKSYEDIVANFKDWKESLITLDEVSGEDIYEEMKKTLNDNALSEEDYGQLKASDYCGLKGYFPVVDQEHLNAALTVLAKCKASDSIKGRILAALHRKANRLELDLTDSFDNVSEPCNNNDKISVDDAVAAYESAKNTLVELGVEIPGLKPEGKTDQESEIEILESQLEAANEELDHLSNENKNLKAQLKDELATRTVDMKMLSGTFEIADRVQEIEDHKARTLDSLQDGLKDLEKQFKIQDFVSNDGISNNPSETVEDPTLSQNDSKAGSTTEADEKAKAEEQKFKLYDEYNAKVARYGRPMADKWLARVQKQNGSIQSID
jgi:hypothetical protein